MLGDKLVVTSLAGWWAATFASQKNGEETKVPIAKQGRVYTYEVLTHQVTRVYI